MRTGAYGIERIQNRITGRKGSYHFRVPVRLWGPDLSRDRHLSISAPRTVEIGDVLTGGPLTSTEKAAAQRTVLSKLGLFSGSIVFIWLIAGSWQTPAFIMGAVTCAYPVIAVADRVIRGRSSRDRAAAASITLILIALIAANLVGVLSTLTGTIDSLDDQLPILLGISFYALQVAGVASDVLRDLIPRPRLLDYLVFVLLGFKFYSGPLERAIDLDKIVNRVEPASLERVWDGFSWALLGFFLKFVVANPLSPLIELNTSDPISTTAVAIIAELRIYFDFAGYSFMAVGAAKMIGIELTNNFAQPFYAPNIREFWYRWHISLGNWLRHNIYSPSRDALRAHRVPTTLLAPAIFLVSALWHGATFNFALWGIIHALAFFLFVRVLSKYRWHPVLAHGSIIVLLVFVRLLYIDQNFDRLRRKLADYGNFELWKRGWKEVISLNLGSAGERAITALLIGMIFVLLEILSARIYRTNDYRLFRSPWVMMIILVLSLALSNQQPDAIFVYARR